MSKFRICISSEKSDPVFLYPGSVGERNLVEALAEAVCQKNVGLFRTKKHVYDAIIAGANELLYTLKSEVRPQ